MEQKDLFLEAHRIHVAKDDEESTETAKPEKIKLAGKDGRSDVSDDSSFLHSLKSDKWLQNELDKAKQASSLKIDIKAYTDEVYASLQKRGMFDKDSIFNENQALAKGQIHKLKNWSENHPNLIAEFADDGKYRVFERMSSYDPGESFVRKKKLEFADSSGQGDDRVLGIPYAQAMAGDRVYIINGKVFTGWALYFSLSSIKSPEDYAKNVDLAYNVPYLFASLQLKANLSLGVGFDVIYGAETDETAEENIIRDYLFSKLRIDVNKLNKTGFHLYLYGNSYWALRRDPATGLVDKITILQPERLKIFLDPMTTKILFYIYLPPIIGGTTIASYPSDGRYNPNILTGVTLSYPTPIVMHPEDVMHFKINDFTEYPFGFSDIRSCQDSALARMDINILTPIIFKKYSKPIVHWSLKKEGIGPRQIEDKKNEMKSLLEDLEPGSDVISTDVWTPTVINAQNAGRENMTSLSADQDTQIFAATGVPETYFKPKGSTDRMISEQDKTFLTRLKIPQMIIGSEIEEKLIKPKIDYILKEKKQIEQHLGVVDGVEEVLQKYDSFLKNVPKYPKVKWNDLFKQNKTQLIADVLAMKNGGIISAERAAMLLGEQPEEKRNPNKVSVTSPMSSEAKVAERTEAAKKHEEAASISTGTPGMNVSKTMEDIRGGLNVTDMKDESNRNVDKVKDPTQLGGSRYTQHELKGEEPEGRKKSEHVKAGGQK